MPPGAALKHTCNMTTAGLKDGDLNQYSLGKIQTSNDSTAYCNLLDL